MTTEVHIVWATLSKADPDSHPQDRHVTLALVIYDLCVSPTLGVRTARRWGRAAWRRLPWHIGDMRPLETDIAHRYATKWAAIAAKPAAVTSFSSDRAESGSATFT